MSERCPECGAEWHDGETCATDFHQMLAWESEYPGLGEVHHLMVLAYYLQHPSLYSPRGLAEGRRLLEEFVGRGTPPQEVRRRSRARVASNNRDWTITARRGERGSYGREMPWSVRAPNVAAGGPERYVESVRAWAKQAWVTLNTGRPAGGN